MPANDRWDLTRRLKGLCVHFRHPIHIKSWLNKENIYIFVYLFIYLFIYLFTHSFIHSFVCLFCCLSNDKFIVPSKTSSAQSAI